MDSDASENKPGAIDKYGWISLGIGFALAAIACGIGPIRYIFSYLSILVHELGHSATAWCFGYYSIPTFNFTYGGGTAYTCLDNRHYWLIGLVAAGILYALWLSRGKMLALALLTAGAAVYAFLCLTSAHVAMITFMGHGSELLFSGIFLYRAISGNSLVNELERPLYAFAGFFLEMHNLLFSYSIIADPVEKIMYEEGLACGGDVNDFIMLSGTQLHCGFEIVAKIFLLLCFAPPILAFLFHRCRSLLLIEQTAMSSAAFKCKKLG